VIKAIPASQPATRGRDPLVKEQQRDARQDETPVQEYDVKYDKLVIATGCYNQTFGTPGVKENAL
jgi:NADH dehydrogenase FAD-containing subunit